VPAQDKSPPKTQRKIDPSQEGRACLGGSSVAPWLLSAAGTL